MVRLYRNPTRRLRVQTGKSLIVKTHRSVGLKAVTSLIQFFRNGASRPARLGRVSAILIGALVGACTTPYEGRYDFYSGWRKAQIVQIAVLNLKPTGPRCPEANPRSLPPGTSWTVVRYRLGGHTRYASAPAPMQENFAVGDLVYANVSDCLIALQRRSAPG